MIRIIAIGKKHEPWIGEGVKRYQKRLRMPFNTEWHLIPHSSQIGLKARQEESERILSCLNPHDFVILLDERGIILDSPHVSEIITHQLDRSIRVVMIIGGAYGIDERISQRADKIWSLSKLVFPHQLVRLILIEQLYRAQEITGGRVYHHE